MPGQPQNLDFVYFDVRDLHVVETTSGAVLPHTIIPVGAPFRLYADFVIDGPEGCAINGLNAPWMAKYMAESIGPGDDYVWDLGPAGKNLNGDSGPGPHEYSSPATDFTVPGIPNPGTYKLTCLVSICDAAGNPLRVSGYFEGPIIEIRPTP